MPISSYPVELLRSHYLLKGGRDFTKPSFLEIFAVAFIEIYLSLLGVITFPLKLFASVFDKLLTLFLRHDGFYVERKLRPTTYNFYS